MQRLTKFGTLLLTALQCVNAFPSAVDEDLSSSPACTQVSGAAGAAFALTNAPFNNQVVAFSRSASGSLTQTAIYSTGGAGQGVDFDSNYGLLLSSDNKHLYAVSPASDMIAVFSVNGACLSKLQEVYAGDQPVGLTISPNKKYLYALDQSVATPGIFGFNIKSDGTLSPITNQTLSISTPIGVPGTVLFVDNGQGLIVTNKVGSSIDYFTVGSNGAAKGPITTTQSSGNRPFGAALSNDGTIFIVESGLPVFTNAAISTYKPLTDGALHPITKSEKNQQSDGCWIILSKNNQYAYTANFISGTLSSYSVGSDDSATLIDGVASNQGNGSQPVDLAVSSDGKYLYNLLRGYGAITAHAIGDDGSLTKIGQYGQGHGIPANNGASGLAVY